MAKDPMKDGAFDSSAAEMTLIERPALDGLSLESGEGPLLQPSRRVFVFLGLGFLVGCGTQQAVTTLPSPVWPDRNTLPPTSVEPARPQPMPDSSESAEVMRGVLARSRWAQSAPVPSLMNRLETPRYITVHHDGMRPFYGSSEAESMARLELIRRSHRNKGWGDIGYHFAVDRAGRVWEGRPLAYQGAHVKDRNERNVGIVSLGNFDEQDSTPAQRAALVRQVAAVMRSFRVGTNSVRTHQEWAPTACPGRSMQRFFVSARSNGQLV